MTKSTLSVNVFTPKKRKNVDQVDVLDDLDDLSEDLSDFII